VGEGGEDIEDRVGREGGAEIGGEGDGVVGADDHPDGESEAGEGVEGLEVGRGVGERTAQEEIAEVARGAGDAGGGGEEEQAGDGQGGEPSGGRETGVGARAVREAAGEEEAGREGGGLAAGLYGVLQVSLRVVDASFARPHAAEVEAESEEAGGRGAVGDREDHGMIHVAAVGGMGMGDGDRAARRASRPVDPRVDHVPAGREGLRFRLREQGQGAGVPAPRPFGDVGRGAADPFPIAGVRAGTAGATGAGGAFAGGPGV
jgi:hypothetical protein